MKIYDKTEDLSRKGTARGHEIYKWLSDHPEVEQWVVLDDEWFVDFSNYGILPHWVHTNFYGEGLTEEHVKKAINILNGELNHEFE